MTKSAIIVGGSLAGLMHGIMLKRHGYNVIILEQDKSKVRHGLDAGIRAGPDVVKFLQKFDKTNCDYSIKTTRTHAVSRNGKDRLNLPHELDMTSWGLIWNILRANFDGQTSKAVPDPPAKEDSSSEGTAEYRHGVRVTDVRDQGDIVYVEYEDVDDGKVHCLTADFVVAADGSNSRVRSLLMPDIHRQYAGYVSWRGTVRENLVTQQSREMFEGKFTLHFMHRSYILVYIIPNDDGNMTSGERLLNWVWYYNLPEGSPELAQTMTDINGKTHLGTVPRELIRPESWEKQRAIGSSQMPASISELLQRTEQPFVTKIHDVASRKASFFDGKLILVGDALVAFRPHIALSTNQAAFDCLALEEVMEGKKSMREWERAVMNYGRRYRMVSIVLGTFGQSNRFVLAWKAIQYIFLVLAQKVGLL